MSSDRKKYPLVLPAPRENINENPDAKLLPCMSLSNLAASSNGDEYEFGPRIFVGLKGYIFDVTSMGEFLEPKGQFSTYASKDISGLSPKELETLEDWVSLFLCV
ncbi:hypothetical protein B0H13DRAFT_2304012 [Mycena leptocephala]|nr:hypothetical protein B0H13DRAFT_2304012 [Mycena leptocephala]